MDAPIAHSNVEVKSVLPLQFPLSFYFYLLGIVGGSLIPLNYWGVSGVWLCLWMAGIGLSLLFERFLIAIVLIGLGILSAPLFEDMLAAPTAQSSVVTVEWIFGSFAFLTVAIVLFAVGVWIYEATPLGVVRVLRSYALSSSPDGLTERQFSMFNLMGVATTVCLASVPVTYLGFHDGSLFIPWIALSGGLVAFGQYRLALLSCLAFPVVAQFL